jgi:hypothetical protein
MPAACAWFHDHVKNDVSIYGNYYSLNKYFVVDGFVTAIEFMNIDHLRARIMQNSAYSLHACFLLGLLFNHECGSDMFL